MCHPGNHRLIASRGKACREKEKLARFDREIRAAAEAGNIQLVKELQGRKAQILINSLIP